MNMSFDREKYKRQHMAARKESFLKEEKMGKTTKRRIVCKLITINY